MKNDAGNSVENLVDIFEGIASNEIDDMVSLAKKQRIKKNNLEALFYSQIKRLKTRGCPERITELFEKAQIRVVTKALKMRFKKNRIPFLPVIPCNYITVFSQMRMVLNENVAGCNSIYRDNITPANPFSELVKIPGGPYYIFNIDGGTSTKNQDKDEIQKQINKHGRVCLSGIEIIALAVHNGVPKCGMLGMNSYCNEWGVAVPLLLVSSTKPTLHFSYLNNGDINEEWGISSRDRDVVT